MDKNNAPSKEKNASGNSNHLVKGNFSGCRFH